MTPPPTKSLVAWSFSVVLGMLAVSDSAVAAPATSPKGQVAQKPRTSAPVAVLAAPVAAPTDAAAGTSAEAEATPEPAMSASQARSALGAHPGALRHGERHPAQPPGGGRAGGEHDLLGPRAWDG